MTQPRRIVIIGAGLAGASAAGSLRDNGYEGEVLLLGQEPHRPYELPPLSKGLLLGQVDEPDWVHEPDYYDTHGIEHRRGVTAVRLRPGDRAVETDDGAELHYDLLVLATGSHPRVLDVPGADLPGIRTLRTLDDSLALREDLRRRPRVVVVGAGWIGCEVAAAARSHEAEVTVVAPERLPLARVLGERMGEVFRDLHADHGVTWRLGTGVAGFVGGDAVRAVRLADGTELPADLVVLGVGAAPRLTLARDAGLALTDEVPGGGVAVDERLRTSAPEVYAVGDIAAHLHPRYGRRVRTEHWANAREQGRHVGQVLLGASEPFQATPYFFTDQYDLGMEYRGLADPEDELVVRGDPASREFIAFWLRDGHVHAAMNVNVWDDGDALQALVDNRAPVVVEDLQEADLPSLIP
ncbi:Reductase C-terminal [Streptoalloteichus tenebrarius]|uniref:Reductase C-terminal n=1 Tax=Streptoalloteichus tenebrarius (strain ATCC 17920 / DSM 40477 / JCM 4838 / CBS 697.72 / NBRC 16177 / NCIMB 11028 / NRRL B-12390 / A12253. 1 / ISP 5477) TaxID=1933 RepID=A0ABT1I395_STRSD|nr:FAD-dependent oxidoreductase [Streptoalloteichus tenebrarius]MCP2262261.1 Reductase C-terminal [Streptoalloteichus tenebrarius]BFF00759.1 FAD-dependent oxidoreductase [Streptoalloteichus tenebrarius]